MLRYIVHITDPEQEKLVESRLAGIAGIEVERDPQKPEPKARSKAKGGATAEEQQFMQELDQTFTAVRAHVSGKKKLGAARDLLNEL